MGINWTQYTAQRNRAQTRKRTIKDLSDTKEKVIQRPKEENRWP